MKPLFVSFYTPEYAEEARGLVDSLLAFDCDYDVRRIESRGSWVRNCAGKAEFLAMMLRDHAAGRPIVWLDADARVVASPVLFDSLDCDVAAHWRNGTELLSGTLYFGSTSIARGLCRTWASWCEELPNEWDQRCLQRAIDSSEAELRIERLPSSYTRIFDANEMGEPVILHRQASRRLRGKVG